MVDEYKYCLYAFNGDPMCFAHVLLNALHMRSQDFDVVLVVEGTATQRIKSFHEDRSTPFYDLYKKVKEAEIITAVCEACATKFRAKEATIAEGLPLVGDMNGHPAMANYIEKGYKIITF